MRRPRQPFNYKAAAPADMPRHPVLSLPEGAPPNPFLVASFAECCLCRGALCAHNTAAAVAKALVGRLEPDPARHRRRYATATFFISAHFIFAETPLKIKLFRSKSVSGPATPSTSPPATPDSVKRGRSLSGSSTPAYARANTFIGANICCSSPKDVKRRRSSCFDIDNLVIPENMIQPNMRIFTVEYKEIDIPQWRVTSADDVNADMDISSATASSSAAVPVGASEDVRISAAVFL